MKKEILIRYLVYKIDNEVEAVWVKRNYTKDTFKKETEGLHLRRSG